MNLEAPRQKRSKLTDTSVEGLPLNDKGQKLYWDAELPGFGVRVATKRKVYVVQSSVSGGARSKTVTIGRADVMNSTEARRRAKVCLGEMSSGIDPNQEKRKARARRHTVSSAFNEHLSISRLQPTTAREYQRMLDVYLADWKHRQLSELTREAVRARHQAIGARSPYMANAAMRALRACINTVIREHENLVLSNPVILTRRWFKEERRHTYISDFDLSAWYRAVMELPSPDGRDYLRLLLLTGLRKTEAARIKWADIDFARLTFTITETKNGKALTLPLCAHLRQILLDRRQQFICEASEFVFPSYGNAACGHLIEPKRWVKFVVNLSGVPFQLHDLRRTFVTKAVRLRISPYLIKQLVNHSEISRDVTAGYVVHDVEALREPMEQISIELLDAASRIVPSTAIGRRDVSSDIK